MKTTEQAQCAPESDFPREIENRPALPRIRYRIGAYTDIRTALLYALDRSTPLAKWTHREADDPGIALLEGAAIVGDILTFYQELYANEVFLRTATWRSSIAELVRRLGYRLSPGLGGKATFNIELRGDEAVTIPADLPLQVQLDGVDEPVVFETDGSLTAYPWLSRFHLYRPLQAVDLAGGINELVIESTDGEALELEQGDRLLVGVVPAGNDAADPDALEQAQIIVVDEVAELHGMTLVTMRGAIKLSGPESQLAAFKLGRSFRHFGHNAPAQVITIDSNGTASATNVFTFRWLLHGVSSASYVDPTLEEKEFPMDVDVDDLPHGERMIIQSRQRNFVDSANFTHVRAIDDVKGITMRWGALTGASTLVTLDAEILEDGYIGAFLGEIQFHEVVSPLLTVTAKPDESPDAGRDLYYSGTSEEASTLDGRRIAWARKGEEPVLATVVSVDVPDDTGLHKVTLDVDLTYADFPNEVPVLDVVGNLIDASQGKSEKEAVLGNGDATVLFQTFKLPKSPLTYHYSTDSTPPEVPRLEIYVNDRQWTPVASFFGQGPDEEIYIVREDDDENSYVQFGDGTTGARLPSGLRNVKARYRTGVGAFGPIKTGTTVQAQQRVDNLDAVGLPGVATGGDQRESGDNAREAAPGKVQSLGRLVSLRDVEIEALGTAGVALATARWAPHDGVPAVVVTALMLTGREGEFDAVRDILASAGRCRGPDRFSIIVHEGRFEYVYVHVRYALAPGRLAEQVEPLIENALGVVGPDYDEDASSQGLFGLRRRRFYQPEYRSRIAGTVQNVDGVAWAEVLAFGTLGVAEDPAGLSLPASTELKPRVKPASADNVLRLHNEPDQNLFRLVTAPSQTQEGCDE